MVSCEGGGGVAERVGWEDLDIVESSLLARSVLVSSVCYSVKVVNRNGSCYFGNML